MINKKGNVGPVAAILLFMIFLVNWFIWLGSWINTVCSQMVIDNNLTGIEAFAFSNMNFIIMICMFLGMLGWMYFASEM